MQLEAKIFARKGHTSPWERLEYVVEINILTLDWVNRAFLEVRDEAGYVTKHFQDIFDCLQLVLIWLDENCRIISID